MINLVKKIKTFKGNVCTFDVDTYDDIQNLTNSQSEKLPIVQGSIANVISEGKSYVLNSDDKWIPANRFINLPGAL